MRKIIHIDMDAFFASIEQRDNPKLKGRPVIVGGAPNSRGVVATCSYEARVFGVRSAMSAQEAYRRCPQGIFVKLRFDVYVEVSQQILAIFHEYTDLVEPLSIDEAYLDVSASSKSATQIAKEIKAKIFTITHLTASAGVSYNKFLAKIASSLKKPNGFLVITPKEAPLFLELLPIANLPGIGKVTEKKLNSLNIKVGKDLKKMSLNDLTELFGIRGEYYYNVVRGVDDSPVKPFYIRKSLGKEITLERDSTDRREWIEILTTLVQAILPELKELEVKSKTITLKVTSYDFKKFTRSFTYPTAIDTVEVAIFLLKNLLEKVSVKKVRLLGVSFSHFDDCNQLYFPFFSPQETYTHCLIL